MHEWHQNISVCCVQQWSLNQQVQSSTKLMPCIQGVWLLQLHKMQRLLGPASLPFWKMATASLLNYTLLTSQNWSALKHLEILQPSKTLSSATPFFTSGCFHQPSCRQFRSIRSLRWFDRSWIHGLCQDHGVCVCLQVQKESQWSSALIMKLYLHVYKIDKSPCSITSIECVITLRKRV